MMLSRHVSNREQEDFTLYPEPPQGLYRSAAIDMSIPADSYVYPASMAFDQSPTYAETSNYMWGGGQPSPGTFEDSDLQLPPSTVSSASAPSASSSNVGSPQSHHGQLGAMPDWTQQGLGLGPSIVPNDFYSVSGTEYTSFVGPGMEEFAFEFANTKPPGFVGELADISRPRKHQHTASVSSSSAAISLSSESGRASSVSAGPSSAADAEYGLALNTRSLPSPPSPLSSCPSGVSIISPNSASFSSPPIPAWTASPQTPRVAPFFSQSSGHFIAPLESSYPSLIHPDIHRHMPIPGFEGTFHHPTYPGSPSASSSPQPMPRTGSRSPYMRDGFPQPQQQFSPFQPPMDGRRPSVHSFPSTTYSEGNTFSGDETKEKQRCPHPDCGKIFKDLKAHMLTHQNERPEKCPIQTCDYHIKGFARKYDKNRHTLTHYKGTMVCGFCPGSGSAAEKSFNRADVFKRHLTAVHGVEQTPPNSRKKTTGTSSTKKLAGYPPDATGKCSTCSQTFSNAQDFYEHLDDCVLRIVQQEDPAEAVNARLLAEVENDRDVVATLQRNSLPAQTQQTMQMAEDDEDDDMDDDDDDDDESQDKSVSPATKKLSPDGKSRGMTHSRGGVALRVKPKGRKNKRKLPKSWGYNKGLVNLKKRVMCAFDGPRRLAKDDMMLSTEHEMRIKLSDGKAYTTDLDIFTLRRAEGFHGATDEEKGIWISDDPTEEQYRQMQEYHDALEHRDVVDCNEAIA